MAMTGDSTLSRAPEINLQFSFLLGQPIGQKDLNLQMGRQLVFPKPDDKVGLGWAITRKDINFLERK